MGGLHDAVISTVEGTQPSGHTYTHTEISIQLPAGLKPKDFIGTVMHADISIETPSFSYELRDLYAACTMAAKPVGLSDGAGISEGFLLIQYSMILQGYYNPENGLLTLIPAG